MKRLSYIKNVRENVQQIIVLFFLFFLTQATFGQDPPFRFSHLDIEDGLPDNYIFDMHTDKLGFLWIGTSNGLSRYDGYSFKTYTHSVGDSTSISGNIIKSIKEDSEGYLWLGIIGGALCRFDPVTEQFRSYKYIKENSMEGDDVTSIIFDEAENFWMGTFSCGFQYFDRSTEKFTRFNINDNLNSSTDGYLKNTVHTLIEDKGDPNMMWIGCGQGLYLFDKITQKLEPVPLFVNGRKYTEAAINHIYMENPNELWVSTWGIGIGKFDIEKKEWIFYIPDEKRYNAEEVFSNVIDKIERKSEDEFWVCSEDQGLFIFNKEKEQFTKIENNPLDPYSILSNKVNGIYQDRENRKWVFNYQKGISLLDPANQNFQYFDLQNETACGDKEAIVFDFATDEFSGNLFVTTIMCEQLFVFDKNKKLISSKPFNDFPTSEESYHILIDKKGLVWLAGGTNNGETPSLFTYNLSTNLLEPFKHPDLETVPIHSYKLTDIFQDEDQNIWISTYNGGIIKIDHQKDKIQQLISSEKLPNVIDEATEIQDLLLSKSGKIWMGTLRKGVFSLDPLTQKLKHYPKNDDPQNGLRSNRILTLEEDIQGRIWVGLSSTGIQIIDPDKEKDFIVESYQSVDGLPNEQIWKFIRDHDGNIWMTTQYGLCRFDEATKTFIQYTQTNGIKDPIFFKKGACVTPDGTLFFGQANEFFSISPKKITNNLKAPNLAFTSIKVLEKDFQLEKALNHTDEIKLQYDQNFFTINFAVLNFGNYKKNGYKFKLEGYDQDWNFHTGDKNFANYTKVPPGHYTFKVMGAQENIWTEKPISISIVISPPFWKTWWAYLLYGLAAFALFQWFNQFQLKRKLAQQEADRLKELNEAKTKLFNNITHELRTPLTVILGSVNRAKRLNRNLNGQEVSMIKDNGEHLLNLINQVLDMGKLDAGAMSVDYYWEDIITFLRYITNSFETLADEKNVNLIFEAYPESCQGFFDKEKLTIILSNLLSNAIKFTNEYGKVSVFVKIKEPISDAFKDGHGNEKGLPRILEIRVKDSGIGIKEDKLPFVFDRFYQVSTELSTEEFNVRNANGTGIGLSLCKELVTLIKGQISVKSKVNKGTEFKIELPLLIQQDIVRNASSEKREGIPVVLLVEDNPALVQYIAAGLHSHFQLVIENNGKTGLKKALDVIPDVIISDVVMPEMDGLTLCQKIKEDSRTSHIPVILLTAKIGQDAKMEGLKSGADAYLTKPFDEKELLLRIHNLIEQRNQMRAYYILESGLGENSNPISKVSSASKSEGEHIFLDKIKQIIESQIENPKFSVSSLSKEIGLSHTQLHRKLVALTGQPPIKLMKSMRMKKAKELLISTSLTISEIAYQIGFTDPSYFSKSFKSETGTSPKDYRQNMG